MILNSTTVVRRYDRAMWEACANTSLPGKVVLQKLTLIWACFELGLQLPTEPLNYFKEGIELSGAL